MARQSKGNDNKENKDCMMKCNDDKGCGNQRFRHIGKKTIQTFRKIFCLNDARCDSND